eukprot:5787425-Amphidinium_carterae.1
MCWFLSSRSKSTSLSVSSFEDLNVLASSAGDLSNYHYISPPTSTSCVCPLFTTCVRCGDG